MTCAGRASRARPRAACLGISVALARVEPTMGCVSFASVCIAALAIVTIPSPQVLQDPGQGVPQIVFKSAAGLVTLNVTVQDARAHYVTGLTSADFAVYEDGVQQQVRFFVSTAIPVDLLVLVDRSTSMLDKRAVVREAGEGRSGLARDRARGAALTFSRQVAVAQPLT